MLGVVYGPSQQIQCVRGGYDWPCDERNPYPSFRIKNFGDKQKNPAKRGVQIAARTAPALPLPPPQMATHALKLPRRRERLIHRCHGHRHPSAYSRCQVPGAAEDKEGRITRVMNLLARKIICEVFAELVSSSHTLPCTIILRSTGCPARYTNCNGLVGFKIRGSPASPPRLRYVAIDFRQHVAHS